MQEINLKLDINKVNTVLSALAEIPFKLSADLIYDIRQQAQAQLEPSQADTQQ